jgi:hypothetical protein
MAETSVAPIVGAGGVATFMGRQWTIRGRTVEYYAMLEAEIMRLRGDPLQRLVSAAAEYRNDPQVVNNVAVALSKNFRGWATCSYADYTEFHNSPYGEAFQIWMAIRDQDQALTIRGVLFWLMETAAEDPALFMQARTEILDAIDRASGHTALGNS